MTRSFPETSHWFPKTNCWFLETARWFPVTNHSFLETSRSFPETNHRFPDPGGWFPFLFKGLSHQANADFRSDGDFLRIFEGWTSFFGRRKVGRMASFKIKWHDEPEDHDYPAARSYLNLIYDDRLANRFIAALKKAPAVEFKSKDIFRASQLRLLGKDNSHVATDRAKIKRGEKLSPILLVRDSANVRLIIADGYHRLCAVYSFDEDAVIPCKIV